MKDNTLFIRILFMLMQICIGACLGMCAIMLKGDPMLQITFGTGGLVICVLGVLTLFEKY